jgi:hypothetical protein
MKCAILSFLFLAIFFSGCKNDSGVQIVSIADKSDTFKVMLDAKIPLPDTLSIYYTTDGSTNFSDTKVIWTPVKGNAKKQKVQFDLPVKLVPTSLRIDLGKSPIQNDIYLSKVTLAYKGKAIEFPGTLIFSYFRPDVKKTKINATTGMVRGIIRDGVKQSPSLYPKENPLRDKIDLLTQ